MTKVITNETDTLGDLGSLWKVVTVLLEVTQGDKFQDVQDAKELCFAQWNDDGVLGGVFPRQDVGEQCYLVFPSADCEDWLHGEVDD